MSSIKPFFDAAHAEIYDRHFDALRAIKDSLHLLLRVALGGLPADARVLVAGAGTGAEVRFLAPLAPGWRFTLVDTSDAMLAVARRHAETEGFVERCTFHHGPVSSLSLDPHDAATSVLVSHFLTDAGERQAFFADISARLKGGGPLFSADLSVESGSPQLGPLIDLWLGLMQSTLSPPTDGGASYRASFGRDFAAQGTSEVEAMIANAGFEAPIGCFQFALIRAWVTRKR